MTRAEIPYSGSKVSSLRLHSYHRTIFSTFGLSRMHRMLLSGTCSFFPALFFGNWQLEYRFSFLRCCSVERPVAHPGYSCRRFRPQYISIPCLIFLIAYLGSIWSCVFAVVVSWWWVCRPVYLYPIWNAVIIYVEILLLMSTVRRGPIVRGYNLLYGWFYIELVSPYATALARGLPTKKFCPVWKAVLWGYLDKITFQVTIILTYVHVRLGVYCSDSCLNGKSNVSNCSSFDMHDRTLVIAHAGGHSVRDWLETHFFSRVYECLTLLIKTGQPFSNFFGVLQHFVFLWCLQCRYRVLLCRLFAVRTRL